jgi:phage terminase small subunit
MEEEENLPVELSKNHEQFVDEYFKNGLNATQAYLAVYPGSSYENANKHACRLVVNGGVQLAIQKKYAELQTRNEIAIDEIISKVKKLIDECEGDADRKNLIKAIDLLNKMVGAYAPTKVENINAAPVQINIINPE